MNIVRDALLSVLGLCMMFACVAPIRAANEEMSGSIQDLMTPGEFKAAGLGKLSPEELSRVSAAIPPGAVAGERYPAGAMKAVYK